jgi:hypothetical protein
MEDTYQREEREKQYKELIKTLMGNEKRKLKKNIFGNYVQPTVSIIGHKEYQPEETPKEKALKKYWYYAKKYKINMHKDGRTKTPIELAKKIHEYELKNAKKLIRNGYDKNTGEIGMYLV